jgi:hypothetical protein
MKASTASASVLWVLVVALGYGCAAEVEGGDPGLIEVAQGAALDDGEIHPGCPDFLAECRDGKPKMCKKYSERCEVRIGIIGDSLSDEYQGVVSALPGETWTEQVQDDSRISVGVNEDNPAVRGEPRNDGFSLNWARFGQAATDPQWSALPNNPMIPPTVDPRLDGTASFDAQINGLAAQIAAGEVDVALVWVGHNDLFIRQIIGFGEGGAPAFFGQLIARIVGAAVTLRTAASADPYDIKAKVAIIGLAGAASALNPSLSAAAANAGITFIDSFNTAAAAIVTEQATTGFYNVAGTNLQPFTIVFTPTFSATPKAALLSDLAFPGTGPCGFNPATNGIGCATPAYAGPFQHYDAVHPNTLYMGVVGNQILTDVNAAFGFAMRTITEAQLADTAGL